MRILNSCLFGAMLPILMAAQSPILSFTISALPGELKAGSPVKVHGVLKNSGDEDLGRLGNATDEDEGARNYAKVWDAFGNLAPETKLGARFNGHLSPSDLREWNSRHRNGKTAWQTIKPGAAIEWDEVITKQYDLSKPGTYTVQLEESIWSRAPGDAQFHPTLYKSNVITITVVP